FPVDLVDAGTNAYEFSRGWIEDDEAIVAFGRRHVPVVTQSEFKSQIGARLVVILHVEPERVLNDGARAITLGDGELVSGAGDEGRHVWNRERARVEGEVVVVETPALTTKFQ